MIRSCASTLVVGVLAMAARAQTQAGGQGQDAGADGGPVVVGTPRESWRRFQLVKLDAGLDFRYQNQKDTIRQAGQPDQNNRETRYRELLDLSGEAIVGHRNLLDLTGTMQLGLENIDTNSDTTSFTGSENDFVSLYDLNALILGTSRLPTSVYARREESRLDRAFAGSINETVQEEGITTRLSSATAPTSLQLFRREDHLTGDFGNINTKVQQTSLSLQNALVLTPSQRLETTYTFDEISENQAGSGAGVGGYSDSYTRNDLNLVHTATFGKDAKPHELRSSLRYYEQSGRQSQEHIRWDELLTLRHSDRLETRYSAVADNLDVRGDTQQLIRGEASVRHRLFDSLTSVGSIGAQRLSTPGGFESTDYVMSGQLDYTKIVPRGQLDAAAGVSYDMQSNSERGTGTRILDETYTFIDGFAIIIPRRNVVPGSLVITPIAGFPIYQEGLDYTVSFFADRTEVRGIVGGGFVNGQQLRISYDLGPEPGNDIDTATASFSLRYSINEGSLRGVALYTQYRTVGHTVRADDPSRFRLDDVNDLLLGVQYRRGEFDLKYEYNIHDSEFDPYTLHRLQGLYAVPLNINSSFNAEWTREMIAFEQPANDVTFDRGIAKLIYRVGQSLDLNAGLEYRQEDSTLTGKSTGFDQIMGVTWRRGQTSVYASFRNSLLDGPGSEQTSQLLQFGIHRTF